MKPIKMILALSLAGLVVGAAAQMSPGMGEPHDANAMPCMEGHSYHKGDHMAQHAKELHDKLKLNADQESAWQAMQATIKPPTGVMHHDMTDMEKLTAPERMEKMMEHMKQHQEAMGAHLRALKTFYAKLSPEQQKTFDAETLRPWKKMHGLSAPKHGDMPKPN